MTKNIIKKTTAILSVISVFAVSQAYAQPNDKPKPQQRNTMGASQAVHDNMVRATYSGSDNIDYYHGNW